jgi:hypothetical protein
VRMLYLAKLRYSTDDGINVFVIILPILVYLQFYNVINALNCSTILNVKTYSIAYPSRYVNV